MNWYLEVLKKYAVFDGRARRKEYWFFALFNCIIILVLAAVGGMFGTHPHSILPLMDLYLLATFIPGLAVAARRLHDTDRSGWWLLIALVPIIGPIVLLVFTVTDGQPGANQYGPNPKDAAGLGMDRAQAF